jgi:hypothetical protein
MRLYHPVGLHSYTRTLRELITVIWFAECWVVFTFFEQMELHVISVLGKAY